MSENINVDNIDVSNTFGVSPPRDDSVLEMMRFSRNLDIAKAQQGAEREMKAAEREMEYGKLKEAISTRIAPRSVSSDEVVQNVVEIVLTRIEEPINAAIAPLVELIRRLDVKMDQMGSQLGNRIIQLENGLGEFRDEFKQANIEGSIKTAQNVNTMNRCFLGRPAGVVCFFSGEDPIQLGLPPIRTAADIDLLSLENIDRYCAGYRLPRPGFANGRWAGCKSEKEGLRDFLCLLNETDMRTVMRNNRTDAPYHLH